MVFDKKEKLVCVGVVASPHGVRGELNILSYLEDNSFFSSHTSYCNKAGDKYYTLRIKGVKQRFLIAAMENVTDRNMAEALKGTELYVPRSLLSQPDEEEFYYDDLVGLAVHTPDQKNYGKVVGVYNFGASDVIELTVTKTGKVVMYPFTKEVVPEISVAEEYILVVPPETISAKEEKPRAED